MCIDAHRLFHQERIALVEQMVGDLSHLPMASKRHDEIGAHITEHFSIVCVRLRVAHFGRALGNEIGIGILNGDQFNIRHGDEVMEVGGVIDGVPVAHLDSGNANGHNSPLWRPLVVPAPLPRRSRILTSLDVRREVEAASSSLTTKRRPRVSFNRSRIAWSLGLMTSRSLRDSLTLMSWMTFSADRARRWPLILPR